MPQQSSPQLATDSGFAYNAFDMITSPRSSCEHTFSGERVLGQNYSRSRVHPLLASSTSSPQVRMPLMGCYIHPAQKGVLLSFISIIADVDQSTHALDSENQDGV